MQTLFDRIEKLRSKKILDGAASLTYGDVELRCKQLHQFLKAFEFQPGDRIGIAATEEPEVAALILSCLRLGFPVAMIDPAAKESEAAELLRRLDLKALFVDQSLMENWSGATDNAVRFVWPLARQKKKLLNRLLSKKEPAITSNATYPDCLK